MLAVSDGLVVGTRNDVPGQVPGTFPAGIAIDEADGNYVVLDIGNGFYVNYATSPARPPEVSIGSARARCSGWSATPAIPLRRICICTS